MNDYLLDRYDEANKQDDWKLLIGYGALLFRWQIKHPKDVKEIARVASHWHSYIHSRCENWREDSHPKPHSQCEERCGEIEEMIQKNIKTRLVEALVFRKNELDQQALL